MTNTELTLVKQQKMSQDMSLDSPPRAKSRTARNSKGKGVNFQGEKEAGKKREKFLTAKYGSHQMALIRKRLGEEMWMYDQLQDIYGDQVKKNEIL